MTEKEIAELTAPRLGANEDTVRVEEWHVSDGQQVEVGDRIATLATTKATFEFTTEDEGYVFRLVSDDEKVAVRTPIALILPEPDEERFDRVRDQYTEQAEGALGALDSADGPSLSRGAKRAVEEYGVDVEALPTDRPLRRQDVEAMLGGGTGSERDGRDRRRVAIYGAGQSVLVLVETLRRIGGYQVEAVLDDDEDRLGDRVAGLKVRSGEALKELAEEGIGSVCVSVSDRSARLDLIGRVEEEGLNALSVVDPSAHLAASVAVAAGVTVKSGAVVDSDTVLGRGTIVDNGAIVPHNNTLGRGCHLAPGVTLGSNIRIGDRTLVGIGSSIATGVTVGEDVIVTPGTAVTRDIPDGKVVEGVPGRVIGERRTGENREG